MAFDSAIFGWFVWVVVVEAVVSVAQWRDVVLSGWPAQVVGVDVVGLALDSGGVASRPGAHEGFDDGFEADIGSGKAVGDVGLRQGGDDGLIVVVGGYNRGPSGWGEFGVDDIFEVCKCPVGGCDGAVGVESQVGGDHEHGAEAFGRVLVAYDGVVEGCGVGVVVG